jgi:hypothetical protein
MGSARCELIRAVYIMLLNEVAWIGEWNPIQSHRVGLNNLAVN